MKADSLPKGFVGTWQGIISFQLVWGGAFATNIPYPHTVNLSLSSPSGVPTYSPMGPFSENFTFTITEKPYGTDPLVL
tara:strand:- start:717 stop:950 length:234 start_codon:yes stop_codon:yes gene_type:complete